MATENHIPGIYNWCDKWCEKCSFTSKCRLFENESNWKNADLNAEEEASWDDIFSDDSEEDNAPLFGFGEEEDYEEPEISDEEMENFRQQREIQELMVESHPLTKLGDRYLWEVKDWLDTKIVSSLWEKAKREDPVLFEHLEVISYYFTFIPVKCNRSLRDYQMKDDFDLGLTEEEQSHNGSAKVALLCVNRSLTAWSHLAELLPEQQDQIAPLQELLTEIRAGLQEAFPNAEKFIRPGFDE